MYTKQIYRLLLGFLALFPTALLWGQTPIISAYNLPQEDSIKYSTSYIRGEKLKAFRVSLNTAQPLRVNVPDTAFLGSYDFASTEARSIAVAYIGNINSPWQSKLFFDRDRKRNDFVYAGVMQGLYYTPDAVEYYDTKSPITLLRYQKNFQSNSQEEVLSGTFASNFGPKINVGANFGYVGAKGFYNSNKSRDARYRFFGSYRSDRYDLFAYVANDYYRMSENGGITNADYISNPSKYDSGRVRVGSKDVPVLISTDILFNRLRSGHASLAHRYKLGYTRVEKVKSLPIPSSPGIGREAIPLDTLPRDTSIFVPIGNIAHTFYYNKQSRRFIASQENDLWEKVFSSISGTPSVYRERTASDGTVTRYVLPNDTAALSSMQNTLSLSLMEGFRPWVKAGLSVYTRLENYWVSIPSVDGGSYKNSDKFYSAFVGGELARHTGKGLNFQFGGEFGVLGRDLGAMKLSGNLLTQLTLAGKQFSLEADALVENSRPAYFAQHHHGTYGWWDKDFDFSRRVELGAKINLDSWKTWAEARTTSLQNYVYWGADAQTHQLSELMQIFMLRAGYSGSYGILNWSTEAAFQQGTNTAILPLPSLMAKADLHLKFRVASVMDVHLGLAGYWHNAYYAPYYMPTVQQFIPQSKEKIGGEAPLLTAYADFKIRGSRFFLKMFNVGEALMESSRMSTYLYPYNPMHLSAGVIVDLNN